LKTLHCIGPVNYITIICLALKSVNWHVLVHYLNTNLKYTVGAVSDTKAVH
jgi:hypothetical protein